MTVCPFLAPAMLTGFLMVIFLLSSQLTNCSPAAIDIDNLIGFVGARTGSAMETLSMA